MKKKEAKIIVEEMSPKMFLAGLEGVLRSGNYKTIEFRVTCDNGNDAQKKSKEQSNSPPSAEQQLKAASSLLIKARDAMLHGRDKSEGKPIAEQINDWVSESAAI